MLNNGY